MYDILASFNTKNIISQKLPDVQEFPCHIKFSPQKPVILLAEAYHSARRVHSILKCKSQFYYSGTALLNLESKVLIQNISFSCEVCPSPGSLIK